MNNSDSSSPNPTEASDKKAEAEPPDPSVDSPSAISETNPQGTTVHENKPEELPVPEQPVSATSPNGDQSEKAHGRYFAILCLGALGIVYGDIGTSPLYALRECFHGPHAIAPLRDNVLGVLSLIFWSLIIVISIKYLLFVMRADNKGEGGILSLMSLVRPERSKAGKRWFLTAIGLFGAALLYGDGIITPAISVLSAVEGLNVATPMFQDKVIPITITILILLFLVQRKGTSGIGAMFGPLTMIWFFAIFVLGFSHVIQYPQVLKSVNPYHAIHFFIANGWHGFLVLGSVFLVVTGGEALYADMGHFGKRPIRMVWFTLVLPALLMNYFGQGALLLRMPQAAENPFYLMVPVWALYPMVILATMATSIASQAVISGAFSLTRQAVQLGYIPRVRIQHTSAKEIGQIYIPGINWALMFATIWLVFEFKTSSNLAAAYGVAVTTTMVITTILLFFVERHMWKWPLWQTLSLTLFFLAIDLAFFGANIIKFLDGGWFPLVVGVAVFTLMTTWWRGRKILNTRLSESALPDHLFITSLQVEKPLRVSGTAVFMDRTPDATPHSLLHNIKHNKILHENVILLTIITEDSPHVPVSKRVKVVPRGEGIYRMVIKYGFMEDPDVSGVLRAVEINGKKMDPDQMSFFLGREKLIATSRPGMAIWREKLFAWMTQNAQGAASYFNLPPNRIVELGAQIEL